MKDSNIKSIRYENLRSIINYLKNNASGSRAHIADESGLSLMTVGKVANELCKMEILRQTVSSNGNLGRRAGLLSFNKKKYAAVLYVSEGKLELNIVNMMFESLLKMPYKYNDLFYFEQNLIMFLRDCAAYARSHNYLKDCVGVAILSGVINRLDSSAGEGDNPTEQIARMASDIFNISPVVVMPAIKASSIFQVTKSIEDYNKKNVMYMYFSKEYAGLEIVSNGALINKQCERLSDNNLYDLLFDGNNYLRDKLEYSVNLKDVTALIATLIYNCATIVNPAEILLESTMYECNNSFIEGVRDIVRDKLGIACPIKIVRLESGDKSRSAVTGATSVIRDRWINSCLNK